jgi:hypothetical protein
LLILFKDFMKTFLSIGLTALALAALTACGSNGSEPKGTVSGQNVTIDLSGLGNCATTVENMVIGVQANGASISPDPRVARDYSKPVQFTLTAPDGSKVVYTVTVKGAECLAPAAPPVVPAACTAAAIGSTGYSLVFKGCSAANVATYYAKDECVRDNASGLIWQGQTAAGTGLRGNDQQKTNFDSTTGNQNGSISATQLEIDALSNSVGFKTAVNATNLCGSGAWRLPTKNELLGIVKTTETPMIDNTWFPNTLVNFSYYWSSTPGADDSTAVVVDFTAGGVGFGDGARNYSSTNGGFVRLVR